MHNIATCANLCRLPIFSGNTLHRIAMRPLTNTTNAAFDAERILVIADCTLADY